MSSIGRNTPRAIRITEDITYLETSPSGFKLNGKTGSNFYNDNKRRVGWFVAHIQKEEKEYIAVTNFTDDIPPGEKTSAGIKAKEITKQILSEQGLW